jgi:hypothetical protein
MVKPKQIVKLTPKQQHERLLKMFSLALQDSTLNAHLRAAVRTNEPKVIKRSRLERKQKAEGRARYARRIRMSRTKIKTL